jgi:DNA primase
VSLASPLDQDVKEQVRQATDIVDLVGRYLPLRRQGRIYVGTCPWHDDSRPSLQVNPERQSWKCWVCDIGGDVFSFIMQHERIGFREALELLADRAGIPLRAAAEAKIVPGSPQDKKTLYQSLQWAAQQFQQCLLLAPEAEAARRYVEQRGLTPQSVERFGWVIRPKAGSGCWTGHEAKGFRRKYWKPLACAAAAPTRAGITIGSAGG